MKALNLFLKIAFLLFFCAKSISDLGWSRYSFDNKRVRVQPKEFNIDSSGSLQQEKNLIRHLESEREYVLTDAFFSW